MLNLLLYVFAAMRRIHHTRKRRSDVNNAQFDPISEIRVGVQEIFIWRPTAKEQDGLCNVASRLLLQCTLLDETTHRSKSRSCA